MFKNNYLTRVYAKVALASFELARDIAGKNKIGKNNIYTMR